MMKKLFTLLSVLCMASLAGATTISLTDEGTVINATPGENVNLTISSNADGVTNLWILWMDVIFTVAGGDVITAAMNMGDCSTYGWDPTLSCNPIGLGTPTVEIAGATITGNLSAIVGYVDVGYTGGTQIVSIAPGYMGGGRDVGDNPVIISQGVVTIIPEPAAIVLLGLGGLALLRRRK